MKKGEIYEGIVQEVRFPDKAVVKTAEGETALVRYGIPGQRIQFRVNKKRQDRGTSSAGFGKLRAGNTGGLQLCRNLRRLYLSDTSVQRAAEDEGSPDSWDVRCWWN